MRIEKLLNKIKVGLDNHHNKTVIFFKFEYNPELLKNFKTQFPFAKWSSTKKIWYAPDTIQLRNLLNIPAKEPIENKLNKVSDINKSALIRMNEQLKLKAYSTNTIRNYISEFSIFLSILKNNDVNNLSPEKIRAYLLYCISNGISDSHLQSRLNAIKFYYEQVLKKDEKFFFDIPRPKQASKLPKVIGTNDIKKMFSIVENPKHNLMLKLCYGMGLRVSEIVKIKITDIDSSRMQILIEAAKGKKDRYVPLPASVLTELRAYYSEFKPKIYLFEGQYGGQYATRSVQAVFKNALKKANINKKVGIHSLRHSYATHLLEYGTDISHIQQLLGHNDIKTTLLYTQITNKELLKIKSPLDLMI